MHATSSSLTRRSRSPGDHNDEHRNEKLRRVEQATAQTEAVITGIQTVNGGIIEALQQRIKHILGSREAWREKVSDLEELLVTSHKGRATAELQRLQAMSGMEWQNHSLVRLQEEVKVVGSTAAAAVSDRLAASTRSTVAALETRAAGEASVNEDLVKQVQDFMARSMSTLSQSSDKNLQAQLASAGKDVVIARLQTALTLELARHARYYDEVDALMRIVATLAERSQKVDTTSEELARAKAHVRLLENHLDLNGVVAAIAPTDKVPMVRRASNAPPPPMPPPELKARTPHYFAMRVMAHKDMTLSELVEEWMQQEEKVVAAETRYVELQESVEKVRRDAMLVHQQYLEERQRREISDRRITEMVRERIRGSGDGTVVEELNQLRWSYSQVVDDAAQLAVSLKLSREELADTQKTVKALQQHIRQLERDAQTDQVAATLSELRTYYQTSLDSLRTDFTEAELQRRILADTLDRQDAAFEAARDALHLSRDNATTLSTEVRTTIQNMNTALEALQAKLDSRDAKANETGRLLSDQVSAMRNAISSLQKQTQQFHVDQEAAYQRYSKQVAGLIGAVNEASGAATSRASDGATASNERSEDPSSEAIVDRIATDNKVSSLRQVLNDAMIFVAQQLESTDSQQTSLLDASLSDAQYVSFLVEKLKDVTNQRDSTRAALKEARKIIEQNHLSLVGQALMHEVSVQDSLDSAEAAEKIAALQEQLTATQLVRQSALEELKELGDKKSELEAEVTRLTRDYQRMSSRYADMEAALKRSQEKERQLLASSVDLRSRVQAVLESGDSTNEAPVDKGNEDGEAPTSASANRQTEEEALRQSNAVLESLLQQFGGQLTEMTSAIREATLRKETPAAGDDVEGVEGVGETGDDAGKAVSEYLARTGLSGVVRLITDTLRKADLLKQAMDVKRSATTISLADAAGEEEELLSPEMRAAAARERRMQSLEETVSQLEAERTVMEQKLSQTAETVSKATEQNHKLLDFIKKLQALREADAQRYRAKEAELESFRQSQQQATVAQAPTPGVEAAVPEQPHASTEHVQAAVPHASAPLTDSTAEPTPSPTSDTAVPGDAALPHDDTMTEAPRAEVERDGTTTGADEAQTVPPQAEAEEQHAADA